jgi:hypothetical protein
MRRASGQPALETCRDSLVGQVPSRSDQYFGGGEQDTETAETFFQSLLIYPVDDFFQRLLCLQWFLFFSEPQKTRKAPKYFIIMLDVFYISGYRPGLDPGSSPSTRHWRAGGV